MVFFGSCENEPLGKIDPSQVIQVNSELYNLIEKAANSDFTNEITCIDFNYGFTLIIYDEDFEISIIDTLNYTNKKVESTSNSNVSVENSEGDKIENAKENILKSNQVNGKDEKATSRFNEKEFKVSKNYHYYNSNTNRQYITSNKKEIDSLISENNKSADSLILDKANYIED